PWLPVEAAAGIGVRYPGRSNCERCADADVVSRAWCRRDRSRLPGRRGVAAEKVSGDAPPAWRPFRTAYWETDCSGRQLIPPSRGGLSTLFPKVAVELPALITHRDASRFRLHSPLQGFAIDSRQGPV